MPTQLSQKNRMRRKQVLNDVTGRIKERSAETRGAYLEDISASRNRGRSRGRLSCANQAHGFAACGQLDKATLRGEDAVNVAIVTAYNDMLSAHQPYADYPARIKSALRDVGAVGQVAGAVPAMCDGVTQGQPGMELSLPSRDVVALATAVALSHDTFDAALFLGICDKIVPGMLMGALSFGHLPAIFVPAGPMPSGLPNKEKSKLRVLYAEGKVDKSTLLTGESKSYHSPGTCTFYGTANTNQMMMEFLGLHLPSASFVPTNTPLRHALTRATAHRIVELAGDGAASRPIGEVVDERSIVNAIVAVLATGGSTNHTLHIVSVARAAGILVNWDDFDRLSEVVPLIARLYPNGDADINHFRAAGGTAFVLRSLLDAGLLHGDAVTVFGDKGLAGYAQRAKLIKETPMSTNAETPPRLHWEESGATSTNPEVLRSPDAPFQASGGIKLMSGNLGRAITKISAVEPQHRQVRAPARCFEDQDAVHRAFEAGELDTHFVAVLRGQGPRANGMPELHGLVPLLISLQARGFDVALVTDGRMSGASGKIPAAIHLSPEADDGGPISKLLDGDIIVFDADRGILAVEVSESEWAARPARAPDPSRSRGQAGWSHGRGLFAPLRQQALSAEQGGSSLQLGEARLRPKDLA